MGEYRNTDRKSVNNIRKSMECDWCGSKPKTLFWYGDSNRKKFCRASCNESFFDRKLQRPIHAIPKL